MSLLSTLTDTELLQLLAVGNERAFYEIYLRYDQMLYKYAYQKLRNKEEAQDVVQEVFISIWNNRESFTLKTTLSGYLYKCVLNKIFNIFKHQNIIQQYINSGQHFIELDDYEADYLIREKDITNLIEKEIAAMPPRMRMVYELKRKELLTTKEIAARLGISQLTVSTQVKKALKLLKLKLGIVAGLVHILYCCCK